MILGAAASAIRGARYEIFPPFSDELGAAVNAVVKLIQAYGAPGMHLSRIYVSGVSTLSVDQL